MIPSSHSLLISLSLFALAAFLLFAALAVVDG